MKKIQLALIIVKHHQSNKNLKKLIENKLIKVETAVLPLQKIYVAD
jgi:hypothetical protein